MIHTIGHSTREYGYFRDLLRENDIQLLVDVRSFPGSRRYPWFGQEALCTALAGDGIDYIHLPALGGFRKPLPHSPNTGWRNASFRGYADYMQTEQFRHAVDVLIGLTAAQRTAYMCSEAVPWRCHRSLLSDALLARGVDVVDIIDAGQCRPHTLHTFAVVDGQCITYPAGETP